MRVFVTLCILIRGILGFSWGSDWTKTFCEDNSDGDTYLDLSNLGMKTLRRSFVSGDSIKCLNLAYNGMSSIDRGSFEGLPKLTALNLSANSINFQDFNNLYEFAELKTLIIDEAFAMTSQSLSHQDVYRRRPYPEYDPYNRQRITTERSKYGLIHIRSIIHSSNKEKKLTIFPQLEKLSMSNYHTEKITKWLERFNVPNLTHLRLSGNRLTGDADLPRGVTKNLTHLYINDNEVSTFSGTGLPNLRHLSMNNNNVSRLCAVNCNGKSMTLRTMQNLEYLSIIGNSMVTVDADAFVNSARLISLNLANNLIDNFSRHTFDNLTNLEILKLDDNRLNQIPSIWALTNLRELSIDGNRITSINEASFGNLPKLAYVSLRKNGLSSVAVGTFGNLPTLKTLDISWNKIVRLPENWMRSGIRLKKLNLDGNKFRDVANMSLGYFESLEYVSIGCNPLKTMTIGSLKNLLPKPTLDVASVRGSDDVSTPNYEQGETTSAKSRRYDDY